MLAEGAGDHAKYNVQIVGVVGDSLHRSLRDKVKMTMYEPEAQDSSPGELQYYVRTWGAPQAAMSAIRQAVGQIDSKLVVDGLDTMREQIDQNITDDRMIALLAVSFGLLATLLAGVGLYGVLAYATAQRADARDRDTHGGGVGSQRCSATSSAGCAETGRDQHGGCDSAGAGGYAGVEEPAVWYLKYGPAGFCGVHCAGGRGCGCGCCLTGAARGQCGTDAGSADGIKFCIRKTHHAEVFRILIATLALSIGVNTAVF